MGSVGDKDLTSAATVAIGKARAENAASVGVPIQALQDEGPAQPLGDFEVQLSGQVEEKAALVQKQFSTSGSGSMPGRGATVDGWMTGEFSW